MATGDIIAAAVRPTGWGVDLTVEGWGGDGGSVAYGYGLDAANGPTAATPYLDVTDPGFTSAGAASTVTRRVHLTHAVRLPYPDQALLDEVDDAGDLTVRVALSDWVDATASSLLLSVPAGWGANSGVAGGPSAAVAGLAAANGSALSTPVPIAQWDGVAGVRSGERVRDAFAVAVDAYHIHGVAAVRFTATGANSGHVEAAVVSVRSAARRDSLVGSGYWHSAFLHAFPVDGFTQGERVDVDFEVLPAVGPAAAVLSTAGRVTSADEVYGRNTCSVTCDKEGALDVFAYVDAAAGDDATGLASGDPAAADAAPFATIRGALDAAGDANVVLLRAGTHAVAAALTGSVKSLAEYRVVRAADGEDATTVTVSLDGLIRTRNTRVEFRDVTISHASKNTYFDGQNSGRFVRFRRCRFDIAEKPAVGHGYKADGCYFDECDLGENQHLTILATSVAPYQFDGCRGGSLGTTRWFRVAACRFAQGGFKRPANGSFAEQNLIFANTWVGDAGDSTPSLQIAQDANAEGVAVVGNVFEWSGPGGGGEMIGVSRDGSTTDCRHILLWGNSFVGERGNILYDDQGSGGLVHRHTSVRANAFSNFNIKSDLFGIGQGGADGGRVGNWGPLYGCGFYGNLYERAASAEFTPEFTGLFSRYLNDPVSATSSLFWFTRDGGTETGDGAGDGDYTPADGSPLSAIAVPAPGPAFDLFGTPRGEDVAGAIVLPAAAGAAAGAGSPFPSLWPVWLPTPAWLRRDGRAVRVRRGRV